jgi:hypothetical protein
MYLGTALAAWSSGIVSAWEDMGREIESLRVLGGSFSQKYVGRKKYVFVFDGQLKVSRECQQFRHYKLDILTVLQLHQLQQQHRQNAINKNNSSSSIKNNNSSSRNNNNSQR